MPTLALVSFNIVCATLGGFIALFGLVSFLFKEKFYLGEALISLIAGVIFSPHAANLIRPLEYALGDPETLDTISLYFTRLVLGVQLVIAGVQLPSRYLKTEWKSLSLLLGPGMAAMWICTSLLVWAFVPNMTFLYALAIGACVTPTDPVLSNSIVKGKFADKHIPKDLQNIIIAESGTNDGLGYPFLFLPLFLIRYYEQGNHSPGTAVGMWFYETWIYQIVLGTLYGAVVGWVAKEMLYWAEKRRYVDRESFLVFALALALFIVGTAGMIGTDDILACFIAGNTFTWDDWFRLETQDDSLQPTIDMLLNVAIFIWFGAVAPWYEFAYNDIIPVYRLIFLGILVLLLRRPPIVYLMHKKIHQITGRRQAVFVGFFGPIGVSAIFYLYVSLEYLRVNVRDHGAERGDAEKLGDTMRIVIWFLAICSIIVHGLSVPVGKLGYHIPRTLSRRLSSDPEPFFVDKESRVPGNVQRIGHSILGRSLSRRSSNTAKQEGGKDAEAPEDVDVEAGRKMGMGNGEPKDVRTPSDEGEGEGEAYSSEGMGTPVSRTIRFPDEVKVNERGGMMVSMDHEWKEREKVSRF